MNTTRQNEILESLDKYSRPLAQRITQGPCTPRQLADERAELIAALADMLASADAGDLASMANASDTTRELLNRLNQ
jgi:hypothetical protein